MGLMVARIKNRSSSERTGWNFGQAWSFSFFEKWGKF
jgi:hypothetical protein